MKILYVEDNDDNVYVLQNRLKRVGYDVIVARDGAEGVAMASAERPDIVLMDLSLPVLDGWEATRTIKRASQTQCTGSAVRVREHQIGDVQGAPIGGRDRIAVDRHRP